MEAKASTKSLEREKELLIIQIEKLNSHLLQHSHEHEKHSQNEHESDNVKLYTISTVSKTPDKRPSRKVIQLMINIIPCIYIAGINRYTSEYSAAQNNQNVKLA